MKRIYEPEDVEALPDDSTIQPNVEILEGSLRLHFHADGITFGLVDPRDARFSVIISYERAREMMLRAAQEHGKAEKK